jgi:hypothetical protein
MPGKNPSDESVLVLLPELELELDSSIHAFLGGKMKGFMLV